MHDQNTTSFRSDSAKPKPDEVTRMALLVTYLEARQGLVFNRLFLAEGGPKTRAAFYRWLANDNSPFMSAVHYKYCMDRLWEFLCGDVEGTPRIEHIEPYILPLISEMYPGHFDTTKGGESLDDDLDVGAIQKWANGSRAELEYLYKNFQFGASVVRYARNKGVERNSESGEPLFARGILSVDSYNNETRRKYLTFKIVYSSESAGALNIDGRLYILGDSLIFVGVEIQASPNAFFMVMSRNFSKGTKHGALITRRHHHKKTKRYFTSKAAILRKSRKDEFDDVAGTQTAKQIRDLVEKEELKKLLNVADNKGMGLLFKESMSS